MNYKVKGKPGNGQFRAGEEGGRGWCELRPPL